MSDLALFEIDQSQIIDGVCTCSRCKLMGSDEFYVMEGVCHNCHQTVYGRFRMGDNARPLACNYCGNWRHGGMSWQRLVA